MSIESQCTGNKHSCTLGAFSCSGEALNAQQPQHVAIIMDGNGRWAQERQLPRSAGHEAGVDSVRTIVNECLKYSIPVLSIFAFSRENWQRPEEEVQLLMGLFIESLSKEQDRLINLGVRLRFIGARDRFDDDLLNAIIHSEKRLPKIEKLQLVIAMDYSGRWDITQASLRQAQDLATGKVNNQNREENFAQYLSVSDLPDPDLFIRTSGEQRLSNFFLWQTAYSELYFAPVYWPDFREQAFEDSLCWYAERERRFGKTSEQIQGKSNA